MGLTVITNTIWGDFNCTSKVYVAEVLFTFSTPIWNLLLDDRSKSSYQLSLLRCRTDSFLRTSNFPLFPKFSNHPNQGIRFHNHIVDAYRVITCPLQPNLKQSGHVESESVGKTTYKWSSKFTKKKNNHGCCNESTSTTTTMLVHACN